jgi:uncharacterized protein
MIKFTRLIFWTLVLTLIAGSAADASQLRKGLSAFKRGDYTAAGALLRLPAERGNAEAQSVLCFLYTYGRGVPQSYREAAFWCHRSAGQGSPQGQYQLGLLYNKGHGVPENFVQAYKWLNLAASRASGPKKDFSYRIRDAVATKMSPKQIAKGQAQAVAWRPIAEQPNSAFESYRCPATQTCADH